MCAWLRVRVFGPFEVVVDGRPIGPAGAKRRGLLALLALSANGSVPLAQLIDGLWGEAAPPSAVNVVQSYVSAWRKALRLEESGGPGGRLTTTGNGYRLRLDAEEFDLAQLEQARREARESATRSDYAGAAGILREALGSCGDAPLADLVDLPFHEVAASRLEELRFDLLEHWARAELETGSPHEVVSVLRAECHRYPLRERLTEMLMWALWQEDRQDDALGAYETLRRRLADELGLDPGESAQEMHARILRHDPTLTREHASVRGGTESALPLLSDSFVGRSADMARVQRLLRQNRLITLTGPGGSGKTRLAIEVARETAMSGTRVAFVDCAPLVSAEHIPDRLAVVLHVRPLPGEPVIEALTRATRQTPLLVILDNLEQLRDVAAVVVRLLSAVEELRVLATARGPLHARGEHLFGVSPLATENAGSVDAGPAVTLFTDRATASEPDFTLNPERVELIRKICQRVDGLPLAIELAASRLRVLPLGALSERLHRALDLLESEPGDRPRRHRGLRATVQSSYDLLSEEEKNTFRAFAVFRGGWDLEAAAAVTSMEAERDVLRLTAALRDAGLIERGRSNDQPRFRMLETLREFADEQLHAHDEHRTARDRHAHHFIALAQKAHPYLRGRDRNQWLERLEQDRDNLLAAFSWLIAAGQAAFAAPAACGLWRFWHGRGHLEAGREVLGALLESIGESDPILRGDVLTALGNLTYWQRDWSTAGRMYSEALSTYNAAGALVGVADSHYNLGFIAVYDGALESARAHFTNAQTGYQHAKSPDAVANANAGLALVDRMTGAYRRARRRAEHSLAEQQRLGNDVEADNTRGLLGSIQARNGNFDEAETILRQTILAHYQAGNIFGVIWMLHELAAIAAARDLPKRALQLASAAQTLETDAGGGIDPEQLGLTRPIHNAESRLSPEAAEQAIHEGKRFTVEQAVASALDADNLDGSVA